MTQLPEVGTIDDIGAVWDVVCGAAEVCGWLAVRGDESWRVVQTQVVWPYYLRAIELERIVEQQQDARRAMGVR